MPDFDKNLQPIIKESTIPSTHVKTQPPTPAPRIPVNNNGFSGNYPGNFGEKEDVFAKLRAISGEGNLEKGRFVTNAVLDANKRYTTYNPTIDNYEDFAAYGQSEFKKATNGVLKGLNLTATTFAGGFAVLGGLAISPFTGKFSDIWDNEAMRAIDKWNKKVDDEYLPNYYSEIETNAPAWSRKNWLTTNFLFDKLIKNAGYAAGAMLSGNVANAGFLALGAVLGRGASMLATATNASKAFKLFTPLLKNTARAFSAGKNIEAATVLEKGLSSISDITSQSSELARIGKTAGQFAKFSDSARRGLIAAYSTAGEAAFEALQTANEYRDTLIEKYKSVHGGEAPTGQDLATIDSMTEKIGATSFLGNVALLGITEFTQLPYLMGSTYKNTRHAANGVMGRLDDIALKDGKYVTVPHTAKRFGKLYNKARGVGVYVFDPKEMTQELGQYALQIGSQNYYNKAREENGASVWTDGFLYGFVGEDERGEDVGALTSKAGQESGILGGITGGLMQISKKTKTKRARKTNTAHFIEELNDAPTFKEAFTERLAAANRGIALQKDEQDAVLNDDELEAKDLKTDSIHNYLAPRIKYGRFDMVMDDIDELKKDSATEEGFTELKKQGFTNMNDTIPAYHARLDRIGKFATTIKDLYESLNLRYSGEILKDDEGSPVLTSDGKQIRKYPSMVIDKLVYAATKIVDYDERIPAISGKLTTIGVNLSNILEGIGRNDSPNKEDVAEALDKINSLNINSDIKSDLKRDLKDVIELSMRRKFFLTEYDDIKTRPLNYVAASVEYPEGEEDTTPVEIKKTDEEGKIITKKLEIGKEYSLKPIITKEKDTLILSPKITILSKTLGGEYEVKLPNGKRTFLTQEELEKYDISDTSNSSDKITTLLNKTIDDVLARDEYKEIEKPTDNKIGYINSLEDQKLIDDVETEFNKNVEETLKKELELEVRTKALQKNQEKIKKEQDKIDTEAGSIPTAPPTTSPEETKDKESKIPSADKLFKSSTTESETFKDPTQSAPHIKRARNFLNKAAKFTNRNKLRAILVTPNQEKQLGLTGLSELFKDVFAGKDMLDNEEGLVLQIFVEQDGKGDLYFVDEDGKRLTKVGEKADLQKIIFQTMCTTSLEYNFTDNKGNLVKRYRASQKEEAEAYSKAWSKKRQEIFANDGTSIKPYRFVISKGIARKNIINGVYEKNHVGGILIDENKIAGEMGFLEVSTTGAIVFHGESIGFPKGRVIFKIGDSIDFLNNSRFSRTQAESIYQVIKAMVKKMETDKVIDPSYKSFLQNVLFWKSKEGAGYGNQLRVTADRIFLGDKSFGIVEIDEKESEIIDYLLNGNNVFHNINNFTLSDEKKFHKPFTEFRAVKNNDGTIDLKTIEWKNYQQYLLASKYPNGNARNIENTPLTTNIAAPTATEPNSFMQRYSTLEDFDLPVTFTEAPKKAAPAPVAPKEEPATISGYNLDGKAVNSYTGFGPTIGNISFIGSVTDGVVTIEVLSTPVTENYAKDRSEHLRTNTRPMLSKIKGSGITETSEDEDVARSLFAFKISAEIQKAYSSVEIKEEVVTPPPSITPTLPIEEIQKSDELEAKKADIERRRQEHLNRVNSGSEVLYKHVPDGNNRPLTEDEITEAEGLIQDFIESRNTNVDALFNLLARQGYVRSTGSAEAMKSWLRDRISGELNTPVSATYRMRSDVKAKYDAELQALEETDIEAKKADIERRRKESLYIVTQKDINEGNDVGIRKNEDGSFEGEVWNTDNVLVEDYKGTLKEVQNAINAKYDAELAALEAQEKIEPSVAPEQPKPEEKKVNIDINNQSTLIKLVKSKKKIIYTSYTEKSNRIISRNAYEITIPTLPNIKLYLSNESATDRSVEGDTQFNVKETQWQVMITHPTRGTMIIPPIDSFVTNQKDVLKGVEDNINKQLLIESGAKLLAEVGIVKPTQTPSISDTTINKEVKTEEKKVNTRKFKKPKDDRTRVLGEKEWLKERISPEEIEIFKTWAAENVPGLPWEVLEHIVETHDNKRAWGIFENGVAKFYKRAIRGTEYHEAFEGIWAAFLSDNEKTNVLNEFRNNPGTFVDRETGKTINYAEATDVQAKERIADDFADFRTGHLPSRNVGEWVRKLFNRIIEFFKSFIVHPSLKEQLFKSIEGGRFKEAKIDSSKYETGYSRIPGMSESLAYEFVDDMKVRAVNIIFAEGKLLYNFQRVTSDEIFNKIKEAYIDEDKYEEMGEASWQMLVTRTKDALRTIGIKFNEEDRIDLNDEETSTRNYAPEAFTVDFKKYSPYAIKIITSTLPKTENVNQENETSLELPQRKYSDGAQGYITMMPSQVFATLFNTLSNTTNPIKMEEKLLELARRDSNYVRVFQRFGGNLTLGKFDFENFTGDQWRLFIQFFQTFSKQKPTASVQYMEGDQVNTGTSEMFSATKELQRGWFEGIKAMAKDPNSPIRLDKVHKTYRVIKDALPTSIPKTIKDKLKFLNSIGINVDGGFYTKLRRDKRHGEKDSPQDKFNKAVNAIYAYLQTSKDIVKISGESLEIGSQLNIISELIVNATNPNQDVTHLNPAKKKLQTYGDNNYPSIFENEFNDSETIDELKQTRPELNDEYSEHSVILSKGGLFFNSDGKRIRSIKLETIEGIKDKTTDVGTVVPKLSKGDRFVLELNQELNGKYYVLIPADASTEGMMNLGNNITWDDIISGEAGWKKINKIFKGYLQDDVALALDYENRGKLLNVGNRAKELRFFKDILSPKVLAGINELIEKDSTIADINIYIEEHKSEIENDVKTYITNMSKASKQSLIDFKRIIPINKEGNAYRFTTLDSGFASGKFNKRNMSEAQMDNLFLFTDVNYIINHIEFHKILFGDPYQFALKKGRTEETKRVKSFLSQRRTMFDSPLLNKHLNEEMNKIDETALEEGELGRHNFRSFTRTVTFAEMITTTDLYPNIKEADAESLIMDTTYREVKIKNGQWSDEAETWHQWQMAYTRQHFPGYEYKNTVLRDHDVELLKTPEPRHTIEVLKPIISGVESGATTIKLVVDKLSQMPMYYKAFEKKGLSHLYEKMWREDIGYGVMNSGRKLGATETYRLYNSDGTYNTAPFTGIIDVAWKSYGIQVETSHEGAKSQTRGSQLVKIASMDMFDNGTPIGATPERQAEIQKIYNRNVRALRILHEEGYKRILTKLGIEDNGTSYKLVDPKAVQNTLEHEMLRREMSQNAKDSIQLDENDQFIPFEASNEYKKIKDILYSIVNKSLVSPTMNGRPSIQAAVTLWENRQEGRKLLIKTDSGYKEISRKDYNSLSDEQKKLVVFSSDTLKFYTKEDPYCEIMLPHWFAEKFNRKRFPNDEAILKHLNNTEEGRKILTGIGFRIPTQTMASVEIFRVKGFLPAFMGDTVVVPTEITAKAGSDFDVDKLNTYLKNIYVDENGDIRLVKYLGSEEATKDFFNDLYSKTFAAKFDKIAKNDEFREQLLAVFNKMESIPEINSEMTAEQFDDEYKLSPEESEFYDDNMSLIGEIIDQADLQDMLPSDYIKAQLKESLETRSQLLTDLLNTRTREEYVNNMYKRSLENEYFESLEEMLTLPENFNRLMSPVSDGGLKALGQKLDADRGVDLSVKNEILDRTYMTLLRHYFVSVKKWIGIVAVNITGHSIYQKSKVYIDPSKFKNVSKFDRTLLGNGAIQLPHNTIDVNGTSYASLSGTKTAYGPEEKRQYISERLSGYSTAVVDVANDPYIMKIITSDKIVGVFLFLERLGAGNAGVMFLNQPIIREFIEYVDASGARGLFGKDAARFARRKFGAFNKPTYGTFDVSKLEENIKDYYHGVKFDGARNKEQLIIFTEFLKYAKMAQYNFKMSQATNYDTTSFRSGDAFFKKMALTRIAKDSNIISNVDDIMDSTQLRDQASFIDKGVSAMSAILKFEEDDFLSIIEKVISPYYEQFLSPEDFEKLSGKLRASFLDYVIQLKTKVNKRIADLLVSPEIGIDAQLSKAKAAHPDNTLLHHLQIESSRGTVFDSTKTVKLDVNLKSAYEEDLYRGMFEELKEIEPQLYYNIIRVSLLQGSYQSSVSIKNLIPYSDYTLIAKDIITNLTPTASVRNFVKGWFQRNNFRDNSIVPFANPRFYVEEGNEELIDEYDNIISRYSTKAFAAVSGRGITIKASDRKLLLISEDYGEDVVKMEVLKLARLYKKPNTGEKIDIFTGLNVTKNQERIKLEKGDYSYYDIIGYQKVRYSNGSPLVTKNGEHVYKMVNLYGDGMYASEYYEEFIPSKLNNGTMKVEDEYNDGDIIALFGFDDNIEDVEEIPYEEEAVEEETIPEEDVDVLEAPIIAPILTDYLNSLSEAQLNKLGGIDDVIEQFANIPFMYSEEDFIEQIKCKL